MRLETKKLSEIIPSSYNPRIELQKGMKEYEDIKESIEKFGIVEPLVFNERTNRLVSGHQRLNILKELGYEEVEVSVVNLSEEDERKLNIALNKITGRWDYPKLYNILSSLKTLSHTGFSRREFENLRILLEGYTPKGRERVIKTEIINKYGDLVQLDNNFLKIGDATNENDVLHLIGDNKIDLAIADPPYNVKHETTSMYKKAYKNYDTDMTDEEYYDFNCKWINLMEKVLKEGGVFYIFTCGETIDVIISALKQNKKLLRHQVIVWDRGYPTNNSVRTERKLLKKRVVDFLTQFELIIYGWKLGAKHFISEASKTLTDIWTIKKVYNLRLLHLAEKPFDLIKRMILLSTENENSNVFDIFSGSGKTLLVCKHTNRRCFSIEKDEEFANRIIARYKNYDEKVSLE